MVRSQTWFPVVQALSDAQGVRQVPVKHFWPPVQSELAMHWTHLPAALHSSPALQAPAPPSVPPSPGGVHAPESTHVSTEQIWFAPQSASAAHWTHRLVVVLQMVRVLPAVRQSLLLVQLGMVTHAPFVHRAVEAHSLS
jgi:hypothetical protein